MHLGLRVTGLIGFSAVFRFQGKSLQSIGHSFIILRSIDPNAMMHARWCALLNSTPKCNWIYNMANKSKKIITSTFLGECCFLWNVHFSFLTTGWSQEQMRYSGLSDWIAICKLTSLLQAQWKHVLLVAITSCIEARSAYLAKKKKKSCKFLPCSSSS